MNKVFIRGNLTKDVQLKLTQNDKTIARFSVAVRRDMKNANGEYESDFPSCVAYGNIAETIDKYFHKGSGIIVMGHLQTGSYDDQDGKKVYTTDVIVENIEFDRKPEKKETSYEEKTNEEESYNAMSDDVFRDFGKQVEIGDSDLPW